MKEILFENFEYYNIIVNGSIAENNELRFRLKSIGGSQYIRTIAPNKGYWQTSHKHLNYDEISFIETGRVLYIENLDGIITLKLYQPNESFTAARNTPHNLYMYPNSIVHTLKFGIIENNDWIRCEDLDEWIFKNNNNLFDEKYK